MSNQAPAASIIIPNYNHAQYVGDAISSVLNQTCSDFEVIVVDDGSKDNSREVIDQFGHKVRATKKTRDSPPRETQASG
jgi:glycosyltransferase involved in cell wall biosynthesis